MPKIIKDGRIYGAAPGSLSSLADISITSPTNNEALVWNQSMHKWVNGTVSTVGGLNDLNDVTIDDTSLEEGQELVYNNTAEVFENKTTRVELTQAEYDALANPLPNVDYYITDAPSMQGTSADLSYDGGTDSVYDKIEELNKPKALTLSNVPTGVTSNSKAYKLSNGLILIMVEVTFANASGSWQNVFDIAWSGTTIVNCFGAVTNDQNDNTYAQAFWNTDKITVRVSSPKATLYRGQIIVPVV